MYKCSLFIISIINSKFGSMPKVRSNITTIFGHNSGGVLCMRDKTGSKLANCREYRLELTQCTQVWILHDLGQDLTHSQGGASLWGAPPVAALSGLTVPRAYARFDGCSVTAAKHTLEQQMRNFSTISKKQFSWMFEGRMKRLLECIGYPIHCMISI